MKDIDVDEAMEKLDGIIDEPKKGNLIEASGTGRLVKKPSPFGRDAPIKKLTKDDTLKFYPNTAGNRRGGLARDVPARGDAPKAVAAEPAQDDLESRLLNQRDQAEEQLTCFLYLLVRDHVPVGVVNQLRRDSCVDANWTYNHFKFSDPKLESLARNLAQRLMGLIGPQPGENAPARFEGPER